MSLVKLSIKEFHTVKHKTDLRFDERVDGDRKLPIVIGAFDSIHCYRIREEIKPPRPLTHDLFKILLSVLIL
jgi:bifunctional DNase/RNase